MREGPHSPELSCLRIDDYAVAIHVVAQPSEVAAAADLGEFHGAGLSQFERDILSYAYVFDPPFVTGIVQPARPARLHLPPLTRYIADSGGMVELHAPPDRLSRDVQIIGARTEFADSGISVLTIVLGPTADADASNLDEWELIKLAKLWNGGEGQPDPGSPAETEAQADGRAIAFELEDGARLGLTALVTELFGAGWQPLQYRTSERRPPLATSYRLGVPRPRSRRQPVDAAGKVALRAGTIQLAPEDPVDLLQSIQDLRESVRAPVTDELVAWGGAVQGLLDFRNIDAAELRDVFLQFDLDSSEMRGFHKGTLVHVGERSLGFPRPWGPPEDRCSPMGVSPYLAIPHAVVLHNDERMRSAARNSLEAATRERGHVPIGDAAHLLDEQRRAVAAYLPPVFNYDAERELYEAGHARRGLEHVHKQSEQRIMAEAAALETRTKSRDLTWVLAGIVVAVLAGAQSAFALARDLLPFYVLPALAAAWVVGAVFWARSR